MSNTVLPSLSLLESVILGTVQGLTEFLPVSSSGHLVIAEHFLQVKSDSLTFEIIVHLATLLAVIVFFYKDILTLNKKKILLILVGTVPAVAFALLFKDFIENSFNSLWQNAVQLIITGILLFVAEWKMKQIEKTPKETSTLSTLDTLTVRQALVIGSWQAIAILPAISRSGATVTGGLLSGVKREDAFRYSFLLSIPAILGASVLQLKDIGSLSSSDSSMLFTYLAGAVCAFIFGLISLKWFKYIIEKAQLHFFGMYCILVGVLLLLFVV